MAKIAILYEHLGRSKGGIEAWIYHASEEFVIQGHNVSIFTIDEFPPVDSSPLGPEIISLKRGKKFPILNLFFYISFLSRQLKTYLLEYDLILARSFTMAKAASNVVGQNKVVYVNAAPFSFYGQKSLLYNLKNSKSFRSFLISIASEINRRIAFSIERNTILKCKNVFLSNSRLKETLLFFGLKENSNKYTVIPAGVDIIRFSPKPNGHDNNIPFKILSVCRLAPDKNIQCVIEAVSILSRKKIQIEYNIIGEGFFEQSLKDLTNSLKLSNVIRFRGRQVNVEMWYCNSDVFVLPSLYEGFGSVYIEAMSSGLPCIALSNKSGNFNVASDEIIDDELNGFLVSNNDPNELSEKIQYLIDNPDVKMNFSTSARAKVISSFSWERCIKNILIYADYGK